MNKGFSLIELLIVLVITSIFATISYPSYRHYVARAHRTDGQMGLLDLACRMETYYSKHDTYQTATIAAGKSTDVLSRNQSPNGWYTLSITNITSTTYNLQATPTHAQDTRCQSLTLDSSGVKGVTGVVTDISQCW